MTTPQDPSSFLFPSYPEFGVNHWMDDAILLIWTKVRWEQHWTWLFQMPSVIVPFLAELPKLLEKLKEKMHVNDKVNAWQARPIRLAVITTNILYKKYIYFSFGCIGTQLRLTGSLLHSASFSSCGSQVPGHASLVVIVHGPRCPAACGILDPQLSIPPRSPALQAGLLTIGLPGKPQSPSILFSAKKNRSNGLCRELSK